MTGVVDFLNLAAAIGLVGPNESLPVAQTLPASSLAIVASGQTPIAANLSPWRCC